MPRRKDSKPAAVGAGAKKKKQAEQKSVKAGGAIFAAQHAITREDSALRLDGVDHRLFDPSLWYELDKEKKKLAPNTVYSREIASRILGLIAQGVSTEQIVRQPDMPTMAVVMRWLEVHKDFKAAYARARQMQADTLAAEVISISDSSTAWTYVHARDAESNALLYNPDGSPTLKRVLVPLCSDVIAHNKLRVDARKWYASKVAPRVYGDKVLQEHVGAGGGPMQIAAVDMRKLSDSELDTVQRLMAKASDGDDAEA